MDLFLAMGNHLSIARESNCPTDAGEQPTKDHSLLTYFPDHQLLVITGARQESTIRRQSDLKLCIVTLKRIWMVAAQED